MNNLSNLQTSSFNSIFIVENRTLWGEFELDKNTDLVLCLDFGLYHELEAQGIKVAYLDHIADRDTALKFNAEMHFYIQNWFKDEKGDDLLSYNGYNIGDALLLDVLNDITYTSHFLLSIVSLKELNYKNIFVLSTDEILVYVLEKLKISYTLLEANTSLKPQAVYNFPIIKWTDEQINSLTFKSRVRKAGSKIFDSLFSLSDLFFAKNRKRVFIQDYYPTRPVIKTLIENSGLQVILSDYIQDVNVFKQRRIVYVTKDYSVEAEAVILNYKKAEKTKWIFKGVDFSSVLEEKLLLRVQKNVGKAVSLINSISAYFSNNSIKLFVPVTNLWLNNRLIMNYCRNKNIPIFMILNGLLTLGDWQEAHDSTWVNCYSDGSKIDYFKNADNALPLGDPRMDDYAKQSPKQINRDHPVILIGTAAYNHLDQTSYLAFEFDFLFDVMTALEAIKEQGLKSDIILKVRANGYSHLYRNFLDEYFPGLSVIVMQNMPFPTVVRTADLYISFYSQTIMEAAVLGIPTIYYKKDDSDMFRPYDQKSELVTALNTEELGNIVKAFYSGDPMFNDFLERKTIEKYIGPLDGLNLQRNIDFIHSILNDQVQKVGS